MILEIATLTIDPARAVEFETAVARAVQHFRNAEGCHGMTLERVIEDPSRYQLVVQWETVEHHTVKFRGSAGFRAWREHAGPFFAAPPIVIHTATVAVHFQRARGATDGS